MEFYKEKRLILSICKNTFWFTTVKNIIETHVSSKDSRRVSRKIIEGKNTELKPG